MIDGWDRYIAGWAMAGERAIEELRLGRPLNADELAAIHQRIMSETAAARAKIEHDEQVAAAEMVELAATDKRILAGWVCAFVLIWAALLAGCVATLPA